MIYPLHMNTIIHILYILYLNHLPLSIPNSIIDSLIHFVLQPITTITFIYVLLSLPHLIIILTLVLLSDLLIISIITFIIDPDIIYYTQSDHTIITIIHLFIILTTTTIMIHIYPTLSIIPLLYPIIIIYSDSYYFHILI